MSFNDCKISESQIQTTGVQSQADTLTGSAADNKLVFDALPTLVIEKLNSLIEQMQQQAAAGQIGVTPFDGMTAQTLQAALEQIQADIGGNYGGADGAGKVGYTPSEGVDEDTVQAAIEAVQANLTAYIAKIKAATGAAEVGNAPIAGMTATNVQQALEELRENIDNIVSGIIPGGSITNDMLQGPVSVDKGGTGATTPQGALANLGAGVRPNLLINPFFEVNQRGQTSYSGTYGVYTVDGWLLNNAETATVNVLSNGVQIVAGTVTAQFRQYLESLSDGVYTLTDDEREEQVRAIRRQINDIAKAAPENARKVREEYEKTYVPEISYLSESRYADAQEALQHGVTGQQFAQWDKRLSELTNEKGADDKKVRTEAEARGIVLDEVMQDSTLSDSEKQAIADYVLISSIGEEDEKAREDWENIAKGKVNATDYLRFKDDVSIYEKQAKGSGTDNMANVAEILRGYDGLTDQERDVLFQTFNSTMKNNPFHVSEYEQAVQDNQFYKDLSEEGKSALRALTNEYEQAISEGKELKDWLAKAYMADKEADIAPGVYALYRVALDSINAQVDGNTNRSQEEVEAAVKSIPGLTQYQKAYLWQSANKKWKKNPFGSATVSEYQSGVQEAINPVPTGWAPGEDGDFGPRNAPTDGASTWHKAYDIPANGGDPVVSIMDGTVTSVNKSDEWGGGYGISVRIDHGNGIETEYHHMQVGSADNINVGDKVSQGQQIGKVGSTGTSTGNHLDFQVWKDGQIVDPLTIIPGYGKGPSGYVYDGTVSSGVVSSGVAAAQAAKNSGSSGSSGLKSLDDLLKPDGLF